MYVYYFKRSIDKDLKALEIIKEKEVDTHWLKICDSLEMYNKNTLYWQKQLTEEEFNLLKEVLDNG